MGRQTREDDDPRYVPMGDFAPARYGPAVRDLVEQCPLMELGPGRPREEFRVRLEAFDPVRDLGRPVNDPVAATACRAGLWLMYDFWDESHAVAQDLDTPEGAYCTRSCTAVSRTVSTPSTGSAASASTVSTTSCRASPPTSACKVVAGTIGTAKRLSVAATNTVAGAMASKQTCDGCNSPSGNCSSITAGRRQLGRPVDPPGRRAVH